MTSLERRSLEILVKYSTGLDKKGQPDLFHPIAVERILVEESYDFKPNDLTILRCTALLHDVVEDGYLTLEELREELSKDPFQNCSHHLTLIDKIIEYVDILTHRKGESYEKYMERVCLNLNTSWIKRWDICHNTSEERTYGLDQKTIERLGRKYIKGLEMIEDSLKNF